MVYSSRLLDARSADPGDLTAAVLTARKTGNPANQLSFKYL